MKLKDEDVAVNAFLVNYNDIFISTYNGYGLWFDMDEVPSSGIKSSGVKAINLKDDFVVSANLFDKNKEYVTIFTNNRTAKRVKLEEFEKSSRARRGLLLLREVKTNPYKVIKTFIVSSRDYFGLRIGNSVSKIKNTEITIADRYKTGSGISKDDIDDVFCFKSLEEENMSFVNEEEEVEVLESNKEERKPHQVSLLEIDDRLREIDDFLK